MPTPTTTNHSLTATLTFTPTVHSPRSFTKYLTGVASLEHATIIGQNLVGSLSIHHGVALYLAGVVLSNGDFSCNATPDYFMEGVMLSDESGLSRQQCYEEVCRRNPSVNFDALQDMGLKDLQQEVARLQGGAK